MAEHKKSDVSGPNQAPQKRVLAQGSVYSAPDFQTISAAKPPKKRGKKPAPTRNKAIKLRPFSVEDLFMTDS